MTKRILGLVALACIAPADTSAQEAGEVEEKASEQLTIEFSKTLTFEKRLGGCQANLQIEYWQKGHVAEVQSTLTNPDCAASSGDYVISVRYRGDDGEMHRDEYPETWERADAEPIESTTQYVIGDDVDLISIRSRSLSCTCTDATPVNP